jgi:DNA polymerase-3 subunit alpha
MKSKFIHLHVHSEYSLVDSIIRIQQLIKTVTSIGMPAVALTDQANLFALVKFYKAAEIAGIKPIVGIDVWVNNIEDKTRPHRLVLLVQNLIGYRNLTQLISKSYQIGQHLGIPRLEKSWIETAHQGLIILSGGRDGDVGQALLAQQIEKAYDLAARWKKFVGDRYYLELTRTGRESEEEYIQQAVGMATDVKLPVVATNDVCFLEAKDFDAHEVRVCVHQGCTLNDSQRIRRYSAQQYLRSPEEMAVLFADLPEALENSIEIAKRCNLEMILGKNYLPHFPTPKNIDANEFLCQQARSGLSQRLTQLSVNAIESRNVYETRLELELAMIQRMGFAGYFLIVADFIQWAKDHDIPVGPGRGSGAGSLVAYALKITDLDPLPYDLLFERFLNPERVSMPDFDIDFCMEKRDKVIEYVAQRYGRESVSQIITHGSMTAKAVVRDVGRVLGHPYGFVDRIAKLIPFEVGITLVKALEDCKELQTLYQTEEEVTAMIDMAKTLEGLARNAGKHAGGVVIVPGKLTDFVPLYCEADGNGLVTQFDKDDVEKIGLVKFDFLGLRTLTIIDWALKGVNRIRQSNNLPPLHINSIPLNDVASFELLKRGDTTAVFQLESRGMKELIKRLKPDTFEDIIALVALYRPGPLGSGMVDDFIKRKHGTSKVVYPHPSLEPILKPTYGTILYQEQVMQIAQVLAGFSLGRADLLRRAMGKKDQGVMDKQRTIFIQGAVERGVEKSVAEHIFEQVAEFANYGFNKSHSAAYALLSYQTAWLKTHHPSAFMAAVLSADMDNTDKVVIFIKECQKMHLVIQKPDVNISESRFIIIDDNTLIYGLGAIKGVGTAAVETILEARTKFGNFKNIFDFCQRVDLRKANRRVLEALIRSGAMDNLGTNRATLMSQLPLALQLAEQQGYVLQNGLHDFFGTNPPINISDTSNIATTSTVETDWNEEERLQGEKATLGIYLSSHPMDRFTDDMAGIVTANIDELLDVETNANLNKNSGRKVVIAGQVIEMNHRTISKGRMGSMVLEDGSGRIEVTVFPEQYNEYKNLLQAEQFLIVSGTLTFDDYRNNWILRAEQIADFVQAKQKLLERITLCIFANQVHSSTKLITQLNHVLKPNKNGKCVIQIKYNNGVLIGTLKFGANWRLHPTDLVLKELKTLLGKDNIKLEYGRFGVN